MMIPVIRNRVLTVGSPLLTKSVFALFVRSSRAGLVRRNVDYTASSLVGQKVGISNISNRRSFSSKPLLWQKKRVGITNEDEISKSTDFLHIQNILLQKNQERMNKQILLSEATNFYQRFKINTKWLLIRGNRPFSADEIGTLFSWLILSQIIWIILGTTTFVSIILLVFNTVFAKEMVGNVVGKTLNIFIDGIDVKFQDALVPEWRKGCIRFNNVELKTSSINKSIKTNDKKKNNDNAITIANDKNNENERFEFNLNFHQVEMTLSLRKWLFGHGLIQNISILGMRGEVSVTPPDATSSSNLIEWFTNPEYHLGSVKINDSSITLYDKQLRRDFKISIYNLDIPLLRFEWIINDFLSANVVDGSINHSLFNIHKRQHKLAYINELESDLSEWKRITRLRLDSINVKRLGLDKTNAFNWIEDGELDIIADIMLPNENEENAVVQNKMKSKYSEGTSSYNKYIVLDLKFKFKDLKARFPESTPRLSTGDPIISLDELKPIISYVNTKYDLYHTYSNSSNNNIVWNSPNIAINKARSYPVTTIFQSKDKWSNEEDDGTKATVKSKSKQIIRFHDDISTPNNEIVLNCRVVKNIDELRNMVLFGETGIYDSFSMELYVDLMKMVEEWEYKKKNDWIKVWGSTFASQLIIVGFGAMV